MYNEEEDLSFKGIPRNYLILAKKTLFNATYYTIARKVHLVLFYFAIKHKEFFNSHNLYVFLNFHRSKNIPSFLFLLFLSSSHLVERKLSKDDKVYLVTRERAFAKKFHSFPTARIFHCFLFLCFLIFYFFIITERISTWISKHSRKERRNFAFIKT